MRTALCTLDNIIYNAADFRQTANYIINRQHLVCTSCGTQARHRRQGRDGREACFFSVHAEGCNQATLVHVTGQAGDDHESEVFATGQRIVVDFGFGTSESGDESQPTAGTDAGNGYIGRNGGNGTAPRNFMYRRLSTLLRGLIDSDGYRNSTQTIEVLGRGEFAVPDFFLNFSDVTDDDIGSYHGFWGTIPHTNKRRDSLWLNTGRPGTMSVLLPESLMETVYQRYGIRNHMEIIGADILVLGELLAALSNGKMFVQISDVNQFALRLSR